MPGDKTGLYRKLLQAQRSVETVRKDGVNTFHKYRYATEAAVLETAKRALNDAGLVYYTNTRLVASDVRGEQRYATVELTLFVCDPDTGEHIESTMPGEGVNKGDKAVYKAITGAKKYALLKLLGIATEDDPENDGERNRPALAGRLQPQRPSEPAKPSVLERPADRRAADDGTKAASSQAATNGATPGTQRATDWPEALRRLGLTEEGALKLLNARAAQQGKPLLPTLYAIAPEFRGKAVQALEAALCAPHVAGPLP